jgi:predicted MFS family arabinose efflux permease
MNRNVWLLFLCQALNNTSTIAFVSMSAIIGHSIAADPALATLPYALQMLATMVASIPAGIIFSRLGRRTGFMLGTVGTLVGTVIATVAVWHSNFPLFCLASIPCGLGFGLGQHYRFAASEVAEPARRPRAIALVMAGGVLAALVGPELVKHTKDIAGPLLFVGTYAILTVLPLISIVLLTVTALPPAPPVVVSPTPIGQIVARPGFVTAVVAGLVAYGSMNLIMTSTPLQMMFCGFGVNDSTDVIRAHALCMYAPGFFTGRVIQRLGAHRVILMGGVLTLLCVALSFAEPSFANFMIALMILGLGWNFMFVGATTLLATAHSSAEKMRAQAANDFLVFGTVTATAFSSGAIQAEFGWVSLNLTTVVPILIALGLVGWHFARGSRAVRV